MISEIYIPQLMDQITDRIFIGSYHAALNLEYRNDHLITHILNCTPEPHLGLKKFKIRQLNINDGYSVSFENLWFAIRSIREAIEEGGRILVHCQAGISRSPGMVCAYLMTCGFSWDEALRIVHNCRPQVFPHPNIERSVKKILGQTIDANNSLLGGSND